MAIYLKNKDLRDELILCKEKDELSLKALNMMLLMVANMSTKFSYRFHEDREDCKQFAIIDCFMYWRNYDAEKNANAFSYFTQIIKNGFAKGWQKLNGKCPISKKVSISNNNIYNL